jgi:hypothetical protein
MLKGRRRKRGPFDSRHIVFRRLRDWLSLRDYDEANRDAERHVVARYTRGNVRAQSGRFMTKADYDRLVAQGSLAAKRLDKLH